MWRAAVLSLSVWTTHSVLHEAVTAEEFEGDYHWCKFSNLYGIPVIGKVWDSITEAWNDKRKKKLWPDTVPNFLGYEEDCQMMS